MKQNIYIIIEGNERIGKTTLALLLGKFLKMMGIEVHLQDKAYSKKELATIFQKDLLEYDNLDRKKWNITIMSNTSYKEN